MMPGIWLLLIAAAVLLELGRHSFLSDLLPDMLADGRAALFAQMPGATDGTLWQQAPHQLQ